MTDAKLLASIMAGVRARSRARSVIRARNTKTGKVQRIEIVWHEPPLDDWKNTKLWINGREFKSNVTDIRYNQTITRTGKVTKKQLTIATADGKERSWVLE